MALVARTLLPLRDLRWCLEVDDGERSERCRGRRTGDAVEADGEARFAGFHDRSLERYGEVVALAPVDPGIGSPGEQNHRLRWREVRGEIGAERRGCRPLLGMCAARGRPLPGSEAVAREERGRPRDLVAQSDAGPAPGGIHELLR